ncbi:MAG: HU family DNA-binding protein [Bacteroidaceae bacterium]|nr:HU family DNA-binding protein [Bacteroidaceae bacterium]
MAINYKISRCKNPGKNAVEGTTYYSNKAQKTSDYTFDDLASDISYSTTVTKADAMAVLASIKPFITRALLGGQVVVLQDLGRLQVTIQSKCFSQNTMSASDFSPSMMIKGHKIIFRPEKGLKNDIASGIQLHRLTEE